VKLTTIDCGSSWKFSLKKMESLISKMMRYMIN
ncbi:hypothetical protein SOVF_114270, partial [Spinacia oleracea]